MYIECAPTLRSAFWYGPLHSFLESQTMLYVSCSNQKYLLPMPYARGFMTGLNAYWLQHEKTLVARSPFVDS